MGKSKNCSWRRSARRIRGTKMKGEGRNSEAVRAHVSGTRSVGEKSRAEPCGTSSQRYSTKTQRFKWQKTLGLRTWCSRCESLRGQFCGDCLFMRYGENVLETLRNKKWACPVCRGICNCSFCRIKKGWAPTGSMYRLALSLNFKSVAHYLIATRRGSERTPKSLEGSTAAERTSKEGKGSTKESNENELSQGIARKSFETSNAIATKEKAVFDILDTERDDIQQRSNGNDTIESRLRKRPRQCKMNFRV